VNHRSAASIVQFDPATGDLPHIIVGQRSIGSNQPCFVIAEAGVNHNGRLETALLLVDAAVGAGADAVKFQTFIAEKVVSASAPKAAYQRETTGAGESQLEMVKKLELPAEAFQEIQNYCRSAGIVFMSTPFEEASADLLEKLNVPVFLTEPTLREWGRAMRDEEGKIPELPKLERFASGSGFQIGDIEIRPFTIPHDAADPVGFTFRTEGVKIGFATDLGYMPVSVRDHLRGCDILVIESNHDLEKLRTGPYPWSVKQRVMSRVGHLSNDALAEFFSSDYDGGAAYVVLAHLSEQNNHPEIARAAAEHALRERQGLWQNRVLLASQSDVLEPIRL